MIAGSQFDEAWGRIIADWAERTPEITAIYLFGFRAKGTARPDSDIDLAFQTRGKDDQTPYSIAFFNGAKWRVQLEALLGLMVDLQYADLRPTSEYSQPCWNTEFGFTEA